MKTNLINIELNTMRAEDLRTLAKEFEMRGAWKAKKNEMIEFLENIKAEQIKEAEAAAQAQAEVQSKPASHRHGRTRKIEVWKDGQLVAEIDGLIETFKWATENNVCNVGWVKHSLKNNIPTTPGRKFKEGGYLFKYAD